MRGNSCSGLPLWSEGSHLIAITIDTLVTAESVGGGREGEGA